MSDERQEALKREFEVGAPPSDAEADSPFDRAEKRRAEIKERKDRERASLAVIGMGFGRLVWIVTLGILLANLITAVIALLLSNLGILLPTATR